MRKLTIGMCVYNDYDGVYFTLQSLRLYHREAMNDVEFVIINNSKDQNQSQALKSLVGHVKEPIQYIEFTEYESTSVRNKIFEVAKTPYVLVLDCHVLLYPGAIQRLIEFFDKGQDEGNLLHGPMLFDGLDAMYSSFSTVWSDGMQGQWVVETERTSVDDEPFEIEAQGLGLFSCRKDSWLGFCKHFRGFGGEEVYIHKKYKLYGKKTLCLPFLRWVHRFTRLKSPGYPNTWPGRYRNYILGRLDLGLPFDDVDEHFTQYINKDQQREIKIEAAKLFAGELTPTLQPPTTRPAVVYEIPLREAPLQRCGCGK
jgi:glycosyltransferase involved in cell wall biosynthesis